MAKRFAGGPKSTRYGGKHTNETKKKISAGLKRYHSGRVKRTPEYAMSLLRKRGFGTPRS